MPSRRDFLKTTGGLVLATGGAWAAGHARGADSLLGPPELPQGTLASSLLDALPGKVPLIWTGVVNGVLADATTNIAIATAGINHAFEQSPYLKTGVTP